MVKKMIQKVIFNYICYYDIIKLAYDDEIVYIKILYILVTENNNTEESSELVQNKNSVDDKMQEDVQLQSHPER